MNTNPPLHPLTHTAEPASEHAARMAALLERLPPPGTKRWVTRRKAEIVEAVRKGALTLEEACARYTLSVEEFLSWERLIDSHGVRGLRATRIQQYRSRFPATAKAAE